MSDYKLTYTGEEVQAMLDKIYGKTLVDKTMLNNYVTKTDLNNATINFVTKSYLDGKVNLLASRDYVNSEINGLEQYFQTSIATAVTNLVSKTYVDNELDLLATDLEKYVKNQLVVYATKTYVDTALADIQAGGDVDLSSYATKTYVDTEIDKVALELETTLANAIRDLPTKTYVDTFVDTTIQPYALKTYVDTSLLPYASREYVDQAIASVESGDIDTSVFATKTLVENVANELTGYVQTYTQQFTTLQYVDSAIFSAIEPLASKEYVNVAISQIKPAEVNLSAYATKVYVDGKVAGFVNATTVNELISAATSNLASRTFVSESISSAYTTVANNYALKTYVDSAVSGLSTKTYVNNTITTALTGFAQKTYVDNAITPLASKTYVDTAIKNISIPQIDLKDYATISYVDTAIQNIPATDLSNYATIPYVTDAIQNFTTKEYVDQAIAGVESGDIDTSMFATKQYVDSSINMLNLDQFVDTTELDSALAPYVTESYVEDAINNIEIPPVDLTGYATKIYVDDAVTPLATKSYVDIAIDEDLKGYATETYVTQAIDNIKFPSTDLTGYATEEYVNDAIEQAQLGSGSSGNTTGYQIWVGQSSDYETLVPNDNTLYFILQADVLKIIKNGEKNIQEIYQGTNQLVCGLEKPLVPVGTPIQEGLICWLERDFTNQTPTLWMDKTNLGYNAQLQNFNISPESYLVSNINTRAIINNRIVWRSVMVLTNGISKAGYLLDARDSNNDSSYIGFTSQVPIGWAYNNSRIIVDGVQQPLIEQLPYNGKYYYAELKRDLTTTRVSLLNHPTLTSNEGVVGTVKAVLIYDRILTDNEISANNAYGDTLV